MMMMLRSMSLSMVRLLVDSLVVDRLQLADWGLASKLKWRELKLDSSRRKLLKRSVHPQRQSSYRCQSNWILLLLLMLLRLLTHPRLEAVRLWLEDSIPTFEEIFG